MKLVNGDVFAFKKSGFGILKTPATELQNIKPGMYELSDNTIANVENHGFERARIFDKDGSGHHVLDSDIFGTPDSPKRVFIDTFRAKLNDLLDDGEITKTTLAQATLLVAWRRGKSADSFYVLKLPNGNYYAFKESGFGIFKSRARLMQFIKSGMYELSDETIANVENAHFPRVRLFDKKESGHEVLNSDEFGPATGQKRLFMEFYRSKLNNLLDDGQITKTSLLSAQVSRLWRASNPGKVMHALTLQDGTIYVFGAGRILFELAGMTPKLEELRSGWYVFENGATAKVLNMGMHGQSVEITAPKK